MFQIRGLSDDPWANTQPDSGADDAISKIGDGIKSFFSTAAATVTPTPTVVATTTAPTPTTKATTITPIPTPWYKTSIGIVGIVASAFVGWKYVLPKFRKK